MKIKAITIKPDGKVNVRVSTKHKAAVQAIGQMKAFESLKVMDLIADVYRAGKKEGAKETFDAIDLLK